MKLNPNTALAFYLVLATPGLVLAQHVAKVESSSSKGKPIVPKKILKSLLGVWGGNCKTWFEAGKLADESEVKGTIRPVLDGRFIRHEYEGTMNGEATTRGRDDRV